MKSAQIFGLVLFVLAFFYYRSIAHMLGSVDSGGIAAGLGVMFAFSLCFASAICLIPSSFKLRKKAAREKAGFAGWPWLCLVGINSALATGYLLIGIRILVAIIWAGITRSWPSDTHFAERHLKVYCSFTLGLISSSCYKDRLPYGLNVSPYILKRMKG